LMMNPFSWLQMTNMISYQGLVRTFPKYELGYREIESLVQAHGLRDPKCLNQMMGSARIGRCPTSFRLL
ncbi:hypothetical protein ACK3Y4_20175, partial [Aeromonas caviae]